MSKTALKISTHVLDTGCGRPASDIPVTIYKMINNQWIILCESTTSNIGRCGDFTTTESSFSIGTYKLHYYVKDYFTSRNKKTMYPFIDVVFDIENADEHYHIPLLINQFGYSTYRGC